MSRIERQQRRLLTASSPNHAEDSIPVYDMSKRIKRQRQEAGSPQAAQSPNESDGEETTTRPEQTASDKDDMDDKTDASQRESESETEEKIEGKAQMQDDKEDKEDSDSDSMASLPETGLQLQTAVTNRPAAEESPQRTPLKKENT